MRPAVRIPSPPATSQCEPPVRLHARLGARGRRNHQGGARLLKSELHGGDDDEVTAAGSAQNKSGCSVVPAVTNRPFAVTTSPESKLSHDNPVAARRVFEPAVAPFLMNAQRPSGGCARAGQLKTSPTGVTYLEGRQSSRLNFGLQKGSGPGTILGSPFRYVASHSRTKRSPRCCGYRCGPLDLALAYFSSLG